MKKIFLCLVLATLGVFLLSTTAFATSIPAPNTPSSNYLVGSFYFPAWNLDPKDQSTDGWLSLENFPERTPLLSYYDEGNPEVADWEIKWAAEHGVNFFIFEWERCDNMSGNSPCAAALGKPIETNNLPRHKALHDGFLLAPFRDKMKFAIVLVDNLPYSQSFSSLGDLKNNLMPYLINTYFKKSNYLVINNKPILYLLTSLKDQDTMSGGAGQGKEALGIMRQSVQASGFTDLIIVGHDWQYVNRSLYDNQKLKEYGFDYTFSYVTPVVSVNGVNVGNRPTEQQAIDSQKQSYQYLAANTALPFIVTASPFWDSFPYYGNTDGNWYISPQGYRTVINNAKTIMSQQGADLSKRMIILDAWNEYGEGHFIAPAAKYGFGYLQAAWDTLTNKDNSPNEKLPSQFGKGPYDSIYKQYVQNHERNYTEASTQIYTFTSSDTFIDILNVGFTIQDTDQLTFGGWVKPSLTEAHYPPFGAPYRLASLLEKDGSGHCVVASKNNAWYSAGTVAAWPAGKITANAWHQIMCVYDGSRVNAYVDGTKVGTSSPAISGTIDKRPTRLRLGYSPYAWSAASIANFVFRNVALSDAQILSSYQTTRPNPPANLPGDLNVDGHVDIFDYNLLIAGFGTQYTIFDYNILVENFGK